jgi:predicted secreted protein
MADQPFDWSEYLKLAQELGARNEEACLRSSRSRAYYYVYNLALRRAEGNGFVVVQGESTHSQLWRLFSQSPEPECVYLGQIALRLKDKREKADYRRVYRRIEEEVPQVLSEAQDFAARLRRLAPRHPNPASIRR